MNPSLRRFFLIDGMGAFTSALILGVVMVRFQDYIGMPIKYLYLLASIPLSYCIYDIIFFIGPRRKSYHLRIIAIANYFYSGLSLILLIIHFNQLTGLGLAYFIGEIVVVLILARWEMIASRKY